MRYRFEKIARQEHEADFSHGGVEPLDDHGGIRHVVDAVDASDGRDERVEELLVGRSRGECQLEGVEQGVLLEDLLERAAEHLAELLVLEFLLLGHERDRRDDLLGLQLLFDGLTLLGGQLLAELHAHADALLQRIGDLHRRSHQIPHRSEQEEHQRDAHRRYDVGVADFPLESFVVFHIPGAHFVARVLVQGRFVRRSGVRALHPVSWGA